MRVIKAIKTCRIVSLLSAAILISVRINTYLEVDIVDIQLVQQLSFKLYCNKTLLILQAINQQNFYTYRAYNVCLELIDNNSVCRETLQPYLAIDRDPDNTQILLGIPALKEIRILVDCKLH